MDTTLNRLQKKLDRWELEHLRQHASDLATRLELVEERLQQEYRNAEYWNDVCDQMHRDLREHGGQIGLTMDGRVIALVNGANVRSALEKAQDFLLGFEDDEEQDGAHVALTLVRAALNEIGEAASC